MTSPKQRKKKARLAAAKEASEATRAPKPTPAPVVEEAPAPAAEKTPEPAEESEEGAASNRKTKKKVSSKKSSD